MKMWLNQFKSKKKLSDMFSWGVYFWGKFLLIHEP